MNILVIGNGFDLAHDLSTSYGDFLEFAKEFMEIYLANDKGKSLSWSDKDNKTYVKFIFNLRKSQKNIYSELFGLLNENKWLEHFNAVLIGEGWVDFEKEISRVLQRIDGAIGNPSILINKNTGNLDNKIEEWVYPILETIQDGSSKKNVIESIKNVLLSDLNELTRALELYLIHYVEKEQINKVTPLDIVKSLEIDKIISFNYTSTYERLYGNDKKEYDYIHGKANKDGLNLNTCNMVLGIDEYLDSSNCDTNNEFIEFKKFYQRIFKETGCKYKGWVASTNECNKLLAECKKQEINIFFYGHSLDVTDKDIIVELIKNKNTKTTIFYHNRKSLGKLIVNLVAILGEEYVIINTGGLNPKIVFKSINEEEFDKVNGIKI